MNIFDLLVLYLKIWERRDLLAMLNVCMYEISMKRNLRCTKLF